MGGRAWTEQKALEKETATLYADIAIGASGASTITNAVGISTIAKTATGRYLVTLQDAYARVMDVNLVPFGTTLVDATAQLYADAVNSAKTLTFSTLTAATETEFASGTKFKFSVTLKNASVI